MILRRITQHVKDQNWFAVGLDFVIVVTGILIAFQITNWSEARRQASQTELALNSVKAELSILLFLSGERLSNEPCRIQKIRALSDRLAEDGEDWEADIDIDMNDGSRYSEISMSRILRTPLRPWPDTAWKTLIASETALHLERAQFNRLSIIFDLATETDQLDEMAWRLRGKLSHLALSGTLSAAERRAALETLGEFSAIGDLIHINARYLRHEIKLLAYEYEDAKKHLQEQYDGLGVAIKGSQSVYGECLSLAEYQPLLDMFYTDDNDPKTVQELLEMTP